MIYDILFYDFILCNSYVNKIATVMNYIIDIHIFIYDNFT